MKKFYMLAAFVVMTITANAQDDFRVNYQGASPTIVDFAWAFLFSDDDDEEECDQEATAGIKNALMRYRQGKPQEENVTLTVDTKNGYMVYES